VQYQTHLGDALEILKTIPSNSVDSLVTDPPAGIGLFNLDWDSDKGGREAWIEWLSEVFKECLRTMKPGAHGFVWAIPRTSHWTATALEDAGFQIRDVVTHIFGSGFPKNIAIDKALTRAKYVDTDLVFKVTAWIRERRNELGLRNKDLDMIAGVKGGACHWTAAPPNGKPGVPTRERWEKLKVVLGSAPDWMDELILPAHESGGATGFSDQWRGWGTALKPASEHWILIQKPISEHNIAANVKKFGAGGINIDSSRIPVVGKIPSTTNLNFRSSGLLWDGSERSKTSIYNQHPKGRFPCNLLITNSGGLDCPAKIIDDQSESISDVSEYFMNFNEELPYMYCKRPNRHERGFGNTHPTVKPSKLMHYLITMVTPPRGLVLDPFMGSGTTGVAALADNFRFLGVEKEEQYKAIADVRLKGAKDE
jgi:hypothetical protein